MGTKKIYYFDPQKIATLENQVSALEIDLKRLFFTNDPRNEIISKLDMESALKKLSPKQRQVWQMYAEEGYTLREIAKKKRRSFVSIYETLILAKRNIRKFTDGF